VRRHSTIETPAAQGRCRATTRAGHACTRSRHADAPCCGTHLNNPDRQTSELRRAIRTWCRQECRRIEYQYLRRRRAERFVTLLFADERDELAAAVLSALDRWPYAEERLVAVGIDEHTITIAHRQHLRDALLHALAGIQRRRPARAALRVLQGGRR